MAWKKMLFIIIHDIARSFIIGNDNPRVYNHHLDVKTNLYPQSEVIIFNIVRKNSMQNRLVIANESIIDLVTIF